MKQRVVKILLKYLNYFTRWLSIGFGVTFFGGGVIAIIFYKEVTYNLTGFIMSEFNFLFLSIIFYLFNYGIKDIYTRYVVACRKQN